mmetsp:Transcript_19387/g.60845  ORF Transcript_19387/g.60845 Transcript_19387/m.60845 type:complete len:205 (-) Transcript_19387:499-1113(-)
MCTPAFAPPSSERSTAACTAWRFRAARFSSKAAVAQPRTTPPSRPLLSPICHFRTAASTVARARLSCRPCSAARSFKRLWCFCSASVSSCRSLSSYLPASPACAALAFQARKQPCSRPRPLPSAARRSCSSTARNCRPREDWAWPCLRQFMKTCVSRPLRDPSSHFATALSMLLWDALCRASTASSVACISLACLCASSCSCRW